MNELQHKYYGQNTRGSTLFIVFNIGQCQVCGDEVIEPNSVFTQTPEWKLKKLGLLRRNPPKEEIVPLEGGGYGCTNCS